MAQKIQRWLDLLAALLRRNYPIPFEELIRDVPGYQDPEQAAETRRRMFERDKDELDAFGVPITTCDLGDNETGYGLNRKEFYLPYLEVLADGRTGPADRVDRFGYRSLPTLAFEPDELKALSEAGPRLRTLGIPSLVEDARSALRKLGADLPLETPEPGSDAGYGEALIRKNFAQLMATARLFAFAFTEFQGSAKAMIFRVTGLPGILPPVLAACPGNNVIAEGFDLRNEFARIRGRPAMSIPSAEGMLREQRGPEVGRAVPALSLLRVPESQPAVRRP